MSGALAWRVLHLALDVFRGALTIERAISKLPPEERQQRRQEDSAAVLAQFKTWLDKQSVPPKSLLGKAIAYTLSQWPRLVIYLDDERLNIDNNGVENAIRPFAVGRKNWLFADSQSGAVASANLYSLSLIHI